MTVAPESRGLPQSTSLPLITFTSIFFVLAISSKYLFQSEKLIFGEFLKFILQNICFLASVQLVKFFSTFRPFSIILFIIEFDIQSQNLGLPLPHSKKNPMCFIFSVPDPSASDFFDDFNLKSFSVTLI